MTTFEVLAAVNDPFDDSEAGQGAISNIKLSQAQVKFTTFECSSDAEDSKLVVRSAIIDLAAIKDVFDDPEAWMVINA